MVVGVGVINNCRVRSIKQAIDYLIDAVSKAGINAVKNIYQ